MNTEFVHTKNVKRLMAGVDQLVKCQAGMPGMMLVFGEPGTGKTRTVLWWKLKNTKEDARIPLIRANKISTARSILENIATELGVLPERKTNDIYKQLRDLLRERQRPIIVDEVDYLCHGGIIEILRDLHDDTGAPVIMMGMSQADKKLARFMPLWDRTMARIKFHLLDKEDIKQMATEICEVEFDQSAIDYISDRSGGKLRRVKIDFDRGERIAKANKLTKVSGDLLQKGDDR